jgi:hypothetical protein
VWFRRARLLIVSPDSRANLARRQAETPLIAPFRFAGPAQGKQRSSARGPRARQSTYRRTARDLS